MTTVVISQPMYFPWIGFMAQMALADVLIWLDDTQFSRGGFTNRVQVKTATGSVWMSIPLVGKGAFQPIEALRTPNEAWRRGHRDLLRQQLRGAPYRDQALAVFDSAIVHERLVDVLVASAEELAAVAGVRPAKTLRSSVLGVAGGGWRRVLDLVRSVDGTRYVTGHGGAAYLDHEAFEMAGVSVDYMDYAPRPWRQEHGDFTSYVTGLDPIAWTGEEIRGHLNPCTLGWRTFLARRGVAQ